MKQKILNLLKTKYSNLGLNAEVLEGVATNLSTFVTDENNIENAVAGSETMLKTFQSFADSRVGLLQKELEKHKAELEKLKKDPQPKDTDNDIPAWAKTLVEANQSLQNSLNALQKEKEKENLISVFTQQMSEKGIPEMYYKPILRGREFINEQQVSTFASEIVKDYETFQKEGAKIGFSYTKPPEQSQGADKDDALVKLIEQSIK